MVARTCRGAFIFNIMNVIRRLINIFKEDPYELLKLYVMVLCGIPQNIIALISFVSSGEVSFFLGTLIGDAMVLFCYVYYVIFWLLEDGKTNE